jgi:hypothetical protein
VDSTHGNGVGEIDKRRMRCNEKTHPVHAVNANISVGKWKSDYGTRLQGYFLEGEKRDLSRRLDEHDDWDCLDDLEEAGLLEVMSEVNGFVILSAKGIAVAGRIREWKAKGGSFGTFKYEEPVTAGHGRRS